MKKIILLILAISLLLVSCSSGTVEDSETENNTTVQETEVKAEYYKISPEEAKAMMDNGATIIDVREQYEYDESHIEGAVLVPLGVVETDIETVATSKDEVILIYCRSGNRSETASRAIVDLGYTEVYDFGGIIDWPYDIVE